jgi:hypothetical protein
MTVHRTLQDDQNSIGKKKEYSLENAFRRISSSVREMSK